MKTETKPTAFAPRPWQLPHLLAEPATVDVEAIKRAAVREFAEAIAKRLQEVANKFFQECEDAPAFADISLAAVGKGCELAAAIASELAAARGVNLDEKP